MITEKFPTFLRLRIRLNVMGLNLAYVRMGRRNLLLTSVKKKIVKTLHKIFDVFAMFLNVFASFSKFSDVFGPIRTRLDLCGPVRTRFRASGCVWKCLDGLEKYRKILNCCGSRDVLESF